MRSVPSSTHDLKKILGECDSIWRVLVIFYSSARGRLGRLLSEKKYVHFISNHVGADNVRDILSGPLRELLIVEPVIPHSATICFIFGYIQSGINDLS